MLSLPTELQIYILQLATDFPYDLEAIPRPHQRFLSEDNLLDTLIRDLSKFLPTRHALTLVSRSFNAIATPLLYACILLSFSSTPRIYASLTRSNASMVYHVIMNFSPHFRTNPIPDHDLASIFALLPNVRILSIRSIWQSSEQPPTVFIDPSLPRAIAKSVGPTLRKLVLHHYALTLFPPPKLSEFTSSLAHLQALVACHIYIPIDYVRSSQLRILLPISLPHLTYLNIGHVPFALPSDFAPTHVHHPTDDILPSILTPALTHLPLIIPTTEYFDMYASIPVKSPSLVSLTISGSLPDITHVLTKYPFPPVSQLIFKHIMLLEDTGGELYWLPTYGYWPTEPLQA